LGDAEANRGFDLVDSPVATAMQAVAELRPFPIFLSRVFARERAVEPSVARSRS
jgi:hypothetical protein